MKISRAICCLLVLAMTLPACSTQGPPPGPHERVTISTMRNMVNSSLLYIAVQQGFFTREGLDVTLRYQPTGKATIDDVRAGRADMGTGAQTPFLFSIIEGGKVAALASIAETSGNTAVIARRDRSVTQPGDLKGKRIGIVPKTSSEFLLHTILIANGLDQKDVTIVPLTPAEMPGALRQGKVDAVSIWDFTLSDIRDELGANGALFSERTLYTEYFLLVAQQEYTRSHPEAIRRMMRALIRSADFIGANPSAARDIVAATTAIDIHRIEQAWTDYVFNPKLSHALVVALENGARWTIAHQLSSWKDVPDFSGYLFVEALKTVKPAAVTIIQ